jgi:hypothetical protein
MTTANSRNIEKRVEDFLDNAFNTEDYFINGEIQKKRFVLLSKLVTDLFHCKNSAACVQNVSSLIVLILNIYNEKFPVDIYSNGRANSIKNRNNTFKRILKDNLL